MPKKPPAALSPSPKTAAGASAPARRSSVSPAKRAPKKTSSRMAQKMPTTPADLVVTYSELDSFRQCPLKHHWSYRDRWVEEAKPGSALSRGSLWHLVMECHYTWVQRYRGKGLTVGFLRQWMAQHLLFDQAGGQNDDQVLVEWMYDGYLECYGLDDRWRVDLIEYDNQVPLPAPDGGPPIDLRFKIDLLVRDAANDQLWLVDHKCLPLTTRVSTPDGTRVVADLAVGDQLIGSDGEAVKITAVTRTTRPTLRLTLRNGQQVECSPEHVWPTLDPRGRTRRELPASDIRPGMRLIPAPAIQAPERNLPVDPYLVGAMLGDGSFTHPGHQVSFTKNHAMTVRRVLDSLGSGHTVRRASHSSKADSYYVSGPVVQAFRDLGLMGVRGSGKFIPDAYLAGSFHQRLELLRGLMDTDGSHRKGVPLYQTGSRRLSDDVAQLVRSLGGVPTVWCNHTPRYQNGTGAPCWEVKMRFPRDFPPVGYHEQKRLKWTPSHTSLSERLTVVSIEARPDQPMVDLEVSGDDHLFVTEGILTHNSARDFSRQTEIDLDDQFGLYSWALRKLGYPVVGTVRSDARTQRNKGPMRQDQRFRRVYTYRTEYELESIARDAYAVARAAWFGGQDRTLYSSPLTFTCSWRCSFVQPHIELRKGTADEQTLMQDFGFSRSDKKHREYDQDPVVATIPDGSSPPRWDTAD